MNILAQVIGIVGVIFAVTAYQFKKHLIIMIMIACSDLMFAIQFLLLGALSASLVNFISIFRNLVFAYLISHNKKVWPYTIFFCLISLIAIIFTWAGNICILAIIGNIAISLAYSFNSPALLRFFSIPSSVCWITYDIYYMSIGGIIMESFTIISIFISLKRFNYLTMNKK